MRKLMFTFTIRSNKEPNMKLNQKGAIDLMLAITLVVVVAVGGFLVYRLMNEDVIDETTSRNSSSEVQDNEAVSSDNENSAEAPVQTVTEYEFENAPISFSYGQDWKLLNDGINFGLETGACGQSVVSDDVTCIDYAMLIPADEEFTNTDQFRINIGVFGKSDNLSARDWDEQVVFNGQDGQLSDAEFPEIANFDVVRTEADYSTPSSKEVRLRYVMTSGDYGIVFFANMFEGDNYSFVGEKDYTLLEAQIDQIANSFMLTSGN